MTVCFVYPQEVVLSNSVFTHFEETVYMNDVQQRAKLWQNQHKTIKIACTIKFIGKSISLELYKMVFAVHVTIISAEAVQFSSNVA